MSCSDDKACCTPATVNRRSFLKGAATSVAAVGAAQSMPVMAGPFGQKEMNSAPIPFDKKLDTSWLKGLFERGEPTAYKNWDEQKYIGMPIGGIGTGTVYIGGDGKLWCWDVFNEHHHGAVPYRPTVETPGLEAIVGGKISPTSGLNYVVPPEQESPWNFNQGFSIVIEENGEKIEHKLDHSGFEDIEFIGRHPVATVTYKDSAVPVEVILEAFTPFIPLNVDESSYPATVLTYKVRNTSNKSCAVSVCGWSENAVLTNENNHRSDGKHINKTQAGKNWKGVDFSCLNLAQKTPKGYLPLVDLPDYGSMSLICLDSDAYTTAGRFDAKNQQASVESTGSGLFQHEVAGVSSQLTLAAGEEREVTFIFAWYFPNYQLETGVGVAPGRRSASFNEISIAKGRRWYASKFSNSLDVATDLSKNLDRLKQLTYKWRDTWYGGTLPNWLLERTIIPAAALQTNTCYRFEDGRFWAWEGVGCCAGTCTHVWHYAQSVGRLFPELEMNLRETTDYGVALNANGSIDFRAEYNDREATDGQAGVILRTLREHQMSNTDDFLQRVWPSVKLAMKFLISQDARGGSPTGIPVGEQHNTLDAEWYGKIPVMASLYLAALRSCVEMATIVGDAGFAKYCQSIFELGQKAMMALFDNRLGYFIQEEDPQHPEAIGVGKGCYIDQVLGQWWANQLGLGDLFDADKTRKALSSLWDYNFCPDVGKLRDSIENPRLRGRPYALAGDAGLVMCTWPKGGRQDDWESHWQYGYFNEFMTGFEHQAASHMIWESNKQEDLLYKGLAIEKSIHDRYAGKLRNPFNEIECSDHYARAMSSHSTFLACSGYEYDGPKKHITFVPRMWDHGQFESGYTSAQGWGVFKQKNSSAKAEIELQVEYGILELKSIKIQIPASLCDQVEEKIVSNFDVASAEVDGLECTINFKRAMTIGEGKKLSLMIG